MFVASFVTLFPNGGEDSWDPVIRDFTFDSVHLFSCDSFRVQFYDFVGVLLRGQAVGQDVHNRGFSCSGGSHKHESVSHQAVFVDLNDFEGVGVGRDGVGVFGGGDGQGDLFFDCGVDFFGYIGLFGEDIEEKSVE